MSSKPNHEDSTHEHDGWTKNGRSFCIYCGVKVVRVWVNGARRWVSVDAPAARDDGPGYDANGSPVW